MHWIAFLLVFPAVLFSQADTLPLVNPSFEQLRDRSTSPAGWLNYGFTGRQPATCITLPSDADSLYQVPDGTRFLSLRLFEDDRWDAIGQELAVPLTMDSCYELQLVAALPAEKGLRLQLLGTAGQNRTPFFIAETPFIRHASWQAYTLSFCAPQTTQYLILRPFYHEDAPKPYYSELFLDDLHLLPLNEISQTSRITFVQQASVSPYDLLLRELIEPLRQWGPKIQFDDQGGLTGWKFTEERPRRIYHPAIQRIIQTLERFPDSKLVIVLGKSARSSARYGKRKRTLQRAFRAAGLPKDRFSIRKWNLKARDYEYLWPMDESGITMRIYLN